MSVSGEEHDSDGLLPRWFGDYVLLKRLGKGGMGQVFLARLPGLAGIDRLCVIKTLRSQWTNDREYVARFVDEARVVVQLNHRNICPVFDVGQVHKTYYLAMDLVPGRDLQAVLTQTSATAPASSIPLDVTLFLIAEVLEALDAAHRLRHADDDTPLNLVHRDVSPHNVLVSFDGEVKLIDFGLAQSALKREHTEPGVVLGKMAYMAPEQARGEAVDRRADVFATGVMLYELVTGERFWHGLTQQQIWQLVGRGSHRPARLAELERSAPDVARIITTAVAGKPDDRYATAAAMRAAIVEAQIGRGVVAGTAELRDTVDALFPGQGALDRKERAALMRLPSPRRDGHESTRIARAPGPAPSASAHVALPRVASSAQPAVDDAPSLGVPPLVGDSDSAHHEDPPTLSERRKADESTDSDPNHTPIRPPHEAPQDAGHSGPKTLIVPRKVRPTPASSTSAEAAPGQPAPRHKAPAIALVAGVALLVVVAVGRAAVDVERTASPVALSLPPTPVASPIPSPTPPAPEPTPPTTTTSPAPESTPPTPPTPIEPPQSTPAPKPAPKPTKKVAEPWPQALPRLLPERVALLKQRCPALPCTRQVSSTQLRFGSLTGDEPDAHRARVVACLEQCHAVQ